MYLSYILILMDFLKKLLFNQIKENCNSSLQRKLFLDNTCKFDYMSYYEATDESEIDFEQALYDAIYKSMTDLEIETIINSLMESGIEQCVLSANKE